MDVRLVVEVVVGVVVRVLREQSANSPLIKLATASLRSLEVSQFSRRRYPPSWQNVLPSICEYSVSKALSPSDKARQTVPKLATSTLLPLYDLQAIGDVDPASFTEA